MKRGDEREREGGGERIWNKLPERM